MKNKPEVSLSMRLRSLGEVTSALMEADADSMRGKPRLAKVVPLHLAIVLDWLDKFREKESS